MEREEFLIKVECKKKKKDITVSVMQKMYISINICTWLLEKRNI